MARIEDIVEILIQEIEQLKHTQKQLNSSLNTLNKLEELIEDKYWEKLSQKTIIQTENRLNTTAKYLIHYFSNKKDIPKNELEKENYFGIYVSFICGIIARMACYYYFHKTACENTSNEAYLKGRSDVVQEVTIFFKENPQAKRQYYMWKKNNK